MRKLSNGRTDWHQISHTSADPSGNGHTPNKLSLDTQGWGTLRGFRGQTFKSLGKLSNGWTDWHQLWFTSADSYGNGRRLNPNRPSIPQGAFGGGGVGSHKFKSLGKLSNSCTDWHRIWYTSADSSGNGHRLNTIRPTVTHGHFGFLGGHKFKSLRKLSNGWTDWHHILCKSADSSGNGHSLNTIRPSIPQGASGGGGVGGHKFKSLGTLSNKRIDWHQMCTRLRIRVGMGIG